jgi:hypothetical protein
LIAGVCPLLALAHPVRGEIHFPYPVDQSEVGFHHRFRSAAASERAQSWQIEMQ